MIRIGLPPALPPSPWFFPKKIKFPPGTLFVRKVPDEQLEGCTLVAKNGFYIVSDQNAGNHSYFDGHKSAFKECKENGFTPMWAQ